MFAVPVTRALRPVGVLLGGSGRARMLILHTRQPAALLKPCSSALAQPMVKPENRVAEALSC